MVDIADLVTYTNFGDHRLTGFWLAGGQISPSPIDFHRRPYNTLALPCERVMSTCGLYQFVNLIATCVDNILDLVLSDDSHIVQCLTRAPSGP